jgi:hypothetical protein
MNGFNLAAKIQLISENVPTEPPNFSVVAPNISAEPPFG